MELDGSYGEGGGALLRTALVMSALMQQPFSITNVRGGMSHPGLDLEDHIILQAIAESCRAETIGAEVGSQSFKFRPTTQIAPIKLTTPQRGKGRGANTLVVLSTLLPIIAKCGAYTELNVIGETYGTHTLTYDYFANLTLAVARKMGLYAWTEQLVAGFGRENYGEVFLEAEPSALTGLDLTNRGQLKGCYAQVTTSNLPPLIAQRAATHLRRLSGFANVPMQVMLKEVPGSSPGAVITTWCEFEGGLGGYAAVGTRGVRIETCTQGAFEALASFIASGATIDAHLADQLFFLSLIAEGETAFTTPRITKRLTTMAWVAKQFRPFHITINGTEEEPGTVTIHP